MRKTDIEALKEVLQQDRPKTPGTKAKRYVDQFFNRHRTRRKIVADVEGNHGRYTVSIEVKGGSTEITTDLVPKPNLCLSCVKDDDPAEAHLCLLNRFDQQDEDEFRCFAYEPRTSEF